MSATWERQDGHRRKHGSSGAMEMLYTLLMTVVPQLQASVRAHILRLSGSIVYNHTPIRLI